MKQIPIVICLSLMISNAVAVECSKVRSVIEGPVNKEYRVLASFNCIEQHFTSDAGDMFEAVKANLLSSMTIVGRPRSTETAGEAVMEFSGKTKSDGSCSVTEDSPDGVFDVVLRLQKNTNQITVSRTSRGARSSTGGVVKRLEMKSSIDVAASSYERRESIESVIRVTGVAASFPGTIRGRLKERFEDFANCFKHELEAKQGVGAQQ